MKQKMLILVITMAICFPLHALADNGVDWLIIQQRTGLSAEQLAEQAREKALQEKKSFKFSELYAEEEKPEKGAAVSFEELQTGQQAFQSHLTEENGSATLKAVPGVFHHVKAGDTVSKIFARYCDKGHWKTISSDNSLDAKHTIYVDQWLFIRNELLSGAYVNPLEAIENLRTEKEQVKSVNDKTAIMLEKFKKESEVQKAFQESIVWVGENLLSISETDPVAFVEQLKLKIENLKGTVAELTEVAAKKGQQVWWNNSVPWMLIVLALFVGFLIAWFFGAVRLRKEQRNYGKTVAKSGAKRDKLQSIMKMVQIRFQIEGTWYNFFVPKTDDGEYDIRPFYKKANVEGDEHAVEYLITQKAVVADIVKGFIKRHNKGEEVPEVLRALSEGTLVKDDTPVVETVEAEVVED